MDRRRPTASTTTEQVASGVSRIGCQRQRAQQARSGSDAQKYAQSNKLTCLAHIFAVTRQHKAMQPWFK
jgi:hypothetical protein